MIKELDIVALAVDLPEHGLLAGDIGAEVLEHSGKGYEVEFTTLSGETLAVLTLKASQLRVIGPKEIANARLVA